MRNPFEDLGKPRVENPRGEEVGGSFACQERGCYNVSLSARYVREVQLLTWQCKDGHTSTIEGFVIE